jgi:hypothetical protein
VFQLCAFVDLLLAVVLLTLAYLVYDFMRLTKFAEFEIASQITSRYREAQKRSVCNIQSIVQDRRPWRPNLAGLDGWATCLCSAVRVVMTTKSCDVLTVTTGSTVRTESQTQTAQEPPVAQPKYHTLLTNTSSQNWFSLTPVKGPCAQLLHAI